MDGSGGILLCVLLGGSVWWCVVCGDGGVLCWVVVCGGVMW